MSLCAQGFEDRDRIFLPFGHSDPLESASLCQSLGWGVVYHSYQGFDCHTILQNLVTRATFSRLHKEHFVIFEGSCGSCSLILPVISDSICGDDFVNTGEDVGHWGGEQDNFLYNENCEFLQWQLVLQ